MNLHWPVDSFGFVPPVDETGRDIRGCHSVREVISQYVCQVALLISNGAPMLPRALTIFSDEERSIHSPGEELKL